MREIQITDIREEQVELGRKLNEEMSSHYTNAVDRYIRDSIDKSCIRGQNQDEIYYLSIYNYWVYGVNAKEFLFYGFDNKNHEQKRQYLTYRSRDDYYSHMNDSKSAYVLNNKYETYKRYKEYYKRDVIQINSDDDFDTFKMFIRKHPTFVFKPSCMGLGAGIAKVTLNESMDSRKEFNNLLRRGKVLKKMNPWRGFEDIDSSVLEEVIVEDESISRLHPDSVNCIRVPVIFIDGHVHIFHPYIKIGRNKEFFVDERVGSILAGIDAETGMINTDGYDENCYKYDKHPDTGITLKGFKIPEWNKVIDMAEILAKDISRDGISYVGWDFAFSKDGWVIVEGNYDGEFLGQLVCEKGHAKELEKILNWSPKKTYWWE